MDLSQPLVCTYYFYDRKFDLLTKLGQTLVRQGYEDVRISRGRWFRPSLLAVEFIEVVTVETVLRRKEEFQALAEAHNVQEFDGCEMGPLLGEKGTEPKV